MSDAKGSPVAAVVPVSRTRPHFDRSQLEYLATGRISELFGPRFAAQDRRRRQTRLPTPPMLLVDRVVAIEAPPAVLGTGVIRTETDVAADSWYLDPAGRMPTGFLVEAGQADLLLISWMGIDLEIGDDRVYRLLGCELTFHGDLPRPGETLSFEIHIDGHAELDGVRLMFFHYDCFAGDDLRLTVRGGQAGFFTDRELAVSAGVRWVPTAHPPEDASVDPPAVAGAPAAFDTDAVRAFADGDLARCFGPGWRATRGHVRTPRIADGDLLLLRDVPEFAPEGGPWERGYLRARMPLTGEEWFFSGHFHQDPCMPGTLMLEGGIQAMAFYLAALGYTVGRDGWRFEPVPGQRSPLRCRAQVTPDARLLTYEVFVVSVVAEPLPTLIADLLCTVDGIPAFHASRVALRLVPDWPLEHWRLLGPRREQATGEPVALPALAGLVGYRDPHPVARVDGLRADSALMLASAWGKPSTAFGPQFAEFDGPVRCPRLPAPPYQFISRVLSVEGTFGAGCPGARITAEYDVPAEAWYFEQNGTPTMPFAVLMEVALQPCGWLAAHVGGTNHSADDLLFRNLDGEGTVLGEVVPGTRVLRTEAELLTVAEHDGMIIESFAIECAADGVPLCTVQTTFGFFPSAVFAAQVGMPPSAEETARFLAPDGPAVDFRAARGIRTALGPPGPMLRMLDRITGYWPEGGPAGLGRLRAEKDVNPDDWYFRAHFFQDPVQPGSLGVEAVCQLLQYYLVVSGRTSGLPGARFEPVLTGGPITWKYRGQVIPADHVVTVELDVTEAGADERGCHAIGRAWLWVDGRRIYSLPRIGMRAVASTGHPAVERVIDPATDRWLADHRPLWTVPVLPLMSVVDLLAHGTTELTGSPVSSLREVQLHRWLAVDGPVRTRVTAVPGENRDEHVVTFATWRDTEVPALSRFETVATALVRVGHALGGSPRPFGPLPDTEPEPHPYRSGALFHGRSYHYLTENELGTTGASGILDAGAGTVPPGLLNQGLLDAALHVIPHHRPRHWSSRIGEDQVSFPHRVDELVLYEALPHTGLVRVEARFAGFTDDEHRLPKVDLQLIVDGRVAVSIRLVLVLLSMGRLSKLLPGRWRAFARDRRYCAGAGLSATEAGLTSLTVDEVSEVEWLPGFVADLYALPLGARPQDRLAEIAIKDHVGRRTGTHPSAVIVAGDLRSAYPQGRPGERHFVRVEGTRDTVTVRSADTDSPNGRATEERMET